MLDPPLVGEQESERDEAERPCVFSALTRSFRLCSLCVHSPVFVAAVLTGLGSNEVRDPNLYPVIILSDLCETAP